MPSYLSIFWLHWNLLKIHRLQPRHNDVNRESMLYQEYVQTILTEYVGSHSLGPIGGLVRFTIRAIVCHVEDRCQVCLLTE